MFKMKKAIAFLLALIMVFSCMPVSLAEGKQDQVTDTVQNPDVVMKPKEEPVQPELELTSDQLSLTLLSGGGLEELQSILPSYSQKDSAPSGAKGAKKNNTRGAKSAPVATQPVASNSYTGFAAFEISPKNEDEVAKAEQYDVSVQLSDPITLLNDKEAIVDSVSFEMYHIHED